MYSNIYITVVIILLHMLQINNNKYQILKLFFNNPVLEGMGFQLREISRKVKIAPPSVKNYLKELEKERLILVKKHRIHNYPVYYANRDCEDFRFLKKLDILFHIRKSGLLRFLDENLMPKVIVLFGSASKGEDTKESDIDLFLECKEAEVDLEKYEKQLKRKINIFFSDTFINLSPQLKNNVINGVVLKGYLKAF